VAVVSGTTITAVTPPFAAGSVAVTVTNPGGQSSTRQNAFSYIAGPAITGVAPGNGPTAGGTVITITGTNFQAGATVTVGGAAATNVNISGGAGTGGGTRGGWGGGRGRGGGSGGAKADRA